MADAQPYVLASVTLDGVEFPASALSLERIPKRFAMVHRLGRGSRGSYEFSTMATLSPDAVQSLLDALTPPQRGAADTTLARRVGYGGRKGRSAMRRLLAKGFAGVMSVNDFPPMPMPPVIVTTADGVVRRFGRVRPSLSSSAATNEGSKPDGT